MVSDRSKIEAAINTLLVHGGELRYAYTSSRYGYGSGRAGGLRSPDREPLSTDFPVIVFRLPADLRVREAPE